MIRDGVFSWQGYDVHLTGMYDGARAWIWMAEVEGTDNVYVAGGQPTDDRELVQSRVCNWIDHGMPHGGPSA